MMTKTKITLKKAAVTIMSLALAVSVFQPFQAAASTPKKQTYKYYKAYTSGGIVKAKGYNYKKEVPKNVAKSASYFNSAAIIGDSRAVDLVIYSKFKDTKAKPYCDIGLSITSVLTKKFVNTKNGKATVLSSLKSNKNKISKVYLVFGLNELGYNSIDAFTKQYLSYIKQIRKVNKKMIVYVVSIMPVTKSKDTSSKIFTNKRIKKFNKKIKSMCTKNSIYYINLYTPLCNSKGYLPESAAYDGIHFKPEYCNKIYKYIDTHTISYK